MQMASLAGKAGDTLVSTSSSSSLLTTHAVKQANGSLALVLINKDGNNAASTNVSLAGFTPSGTATVYSYTPTSGGVTQQTLGSVGTSFAITAPPYSLTTIVIAGSSTNPPPPPPPPAPGFALSVAPTTLSIAQGASATATITVTPTNGFNSAVAFAAPSLPAGVTATFSPTSSATSTTLTLAASASASTGTSIFTIGGTSGALSASTALSLNVTAAAPPPGTGGGPATFAGKASTNSPWYDENDVVVTTPAQITALTVTIAIAPTNVTYNGAYNTIGGQIVDSFSGGANLVYTYKLSAGQIVWPGSYTFAAQLNGNGTTHPTTGDTWTATYTAGGATYTQSGKFQ